MRKYSLPISILLAIICFFLLWGCGSRKVESSKTTDKIESKTELNSSVFNNDIIFNDIFTIKPFDILKPMVIGGKEYVNVIITKDKSKIYKNTVTIVKTVNITKTVNIVKTVTITKTDNTIMYIGLFFVLVAGIVIYFKMGNILF